MEVDGCNSTPGEVVGSGLKGVSDTVGNAQLSDVSATSLCGGVRGRDEETEDAMVAEDVMSRKDVVADGLVVIVAAAAAEDNNGDDHRYFL